MKTPSILFISCPYSLNSITFYHERNAARIFAAMSTLSEAQAQVAAWEKASRDLARGQVARVGDQRLDRSDADNVIKMLGYWRGEVARIQRVAAGGDDLSIALARFPQAGKYI